MKKADFTRKLNKREKIIFILSLLFYFFGFTNSCVLMYKNSAVKVEEEHQNLLAEREKLLKPKLHFEEKPIDSEGLLGPASQLKDAALKIAHPAQLKDVTIINSNVNNILVDEIISSRLATISIVGSYKSVIDYVEYLEKMTPRLFINRFTIKRQEDNINKVMVDIEGVMYANSEKS